MGQDTIARLAWVEGEYDNLRTALRWLIDHDEVARAQLLGAGLMGFWNLSRRVAEGRVWQREVLEMPARPETSAARGGALIALGSLD